LNFAIFGGDKKEGKQKTPVNTGWVGGWMKISFQDCLQHQQSKGIWDILRFGLTFKGHLSNLFSLLKASPKLYLLYGI
jgi:hypothetical protein